MNHEPQFKVSYWRATANYEVCSVFLYYKEMLFSTQIGIPHHMVSEELKKEHIERAKEQLYNQAEAGKKGFEPVKRGGPKKIKTITFEEEDERSQNRIIL